MEQIGQCTFALAPQRADHVRDEDAARLQPHVAVMLAGLGDKLLRDAVGVRRMGDLGEGCPDRAARIERIENDVAAPGILIRSEERRVGKEGVRTCRARWWPYP